MHRDIKRLNKKDPPPEGCRHPAYEVYKVGSGWRASFINGGDWNMLCISFPTEASAYRYILDQLYYGDD